MTEMNEHDTELEQSLKNYYQDLYGNPPASERTWERVAPLLGPQMRSAPWWKRMLRMNRSAETVPLKASAWQPVRQLSPRLSIALVCLIALIVLSGTAYAAIGPTILNNMLKDLGFQQLVQTNQFTDYHQSKNVDGYTLTIQKAYADSNQVVIGYTVQVPPGGIEPFFKFGEGQAMLTTEQGMDLPQITGASNDPTNGTNGNVYIFDAGGIQNNPKELHLRLTIPYSGQGRPPSQISGHLSFSFAVPFHPGRVINLHQSVTAKGVTATLERVVITSTSVRAYISGLGKRNSYGGIRFDLSIGKQKDDSSIASTGPGEWYVDFARPSVAFDGHTQWTLLIQIIQLPSTSGGKITLVPAWTFHFVVS